MPDLRGKCGGGSPLDWACCGIAYVADDNDEQDSLESESRRADSHDDTKTDFSSTIPGPPIVASSADTLNLTRSNACRSTFRDDDNDGDNGHGNSGGFDCSNPGNIGFVNNERVFEFPSPPGFSAHQCLLTDNWGLDTTAFNRTKNKWNGPSCTPNAAWNSKTYLASDPNAWMYDINGEKGFGDHPDY